MKKGWKKGKEMADEGVKRKQGKGKRGKEKSGQHKGEKWGSRKGLREWGENGAMDGGKKGISSEKRGGKYWNKETQVRVRERWKKEKGGENREKRRGKERETRVNEGCGSRGNGWV